ncbi:glycerol-3-phosphate acyltransferase [Paenibacillus soyae]|uniref:Glycerol-3-phosphate acyltransferase n=1 Tax=Paenibacillus soyae TaxID=2969249 RepID=A0A9X2MJ24_9BACL|nr:glycerol-3-phosphate acyltransferase [Paenibacillus soyae]MCR2802723.1 glycerol-3-phosphate acyltransferase [Paenibacillus soyae]
MIAAWILFAFLCGSLMFSYWLGLLANRDITEVGDGNPGAMNLWRSSGYKYGVAGIALDFSKGFIPILWFVAESNAAEGYPIILPAAAALLGHAFSPFMKGRGGKAIAVTFGVWSAMMFAAALAYAVILAALMALHRLLRRGHRTTPASDGLQVVTGMLLLNLFMTLVGYRLEWIALGIFNLVLLAFTHRKLWSDRYGRTKHKHRGL